MTNVDKIQKSPLDYKFELPHSIIQEEPTEEDKFKNNEKNITNKEFLFPE